MVEILDQVDAIDSRQPSEAQRQGHGRQGAAAYVGAQHIACRHETLGIGDRCPYFLGVPFYRLESYQAMLGVPVANATQWELVEQVADSAYPVFEQLAVLAAQGEVIYQDDTRVRILSLMADNLKAGPSGDEANERTGMHTTALVSKLGERTIYLYVSGRAHAGEKGKD